MSSPFIWVIDTSSNERHRLFYEIVDIRVTGLGAKAQEYMPGRKNFRLEDGTRAIETVNPKVFQLEDGRTVREEDQAS